MPTLVQRLNAAKARAEQARVLQRAIEIDLHKRNRNRDLKLKVILGKGATIGNLIEQCLQHVSETDRVLAREIMQEQADNKTEGQPGKPTDAPQDQPTPSA